MEPRRVSQLLLVLLALALAGPTAGGSLLEMSRELWTRVLDGGFQRLGALDPLRVPVVKVDQSEGEASYRVILRGLEVAGLNGSRLESVHVARGKLKSSLGDGEAGYVSYNEQRDLDSVRYRFHTLIKEPKSRPQVQAAAASRQFERIVQYDPTLTRARQEEDDDYLGLGRADGQQRQQHQQHQQQQFQGYQQSRQQQQQQQPQQQQQQQQQHQQQQDVSQYQESRAKTVQQPQQQEQQQQQTQQEDVSQYQESRAKTTQQRKGFQSSYGDMKVASNTTPRNPSQVRVHYSNSYKAEETSRPCIGACKQQPQQQQQQQQKQPQQQQQSQFGQEKRFDRIISLKSDGDSGTSFSGSYGNSRISVEANSGESVDSYGRPVNRFSLNKEAPSTVRSQVAQGPSTPAQPAAPSPVYYRSGPGGVRYVCDDDADEELKARVQQQQQQQQRSRTSGSVEEFEPFKAPMIRLEKQPGYVDVVYASEKRREKSGGAAPRAEPSADPRAYGAYDEIVKSISQNERYIIHNFTEGESLSRRNDAARTAAESQRIRDLLRYAKEHQEQQGYYEEGMELIYHFGQTNGTGHGNESLARRKRQHAPVDAEEDDVMHVIVRIRVPQLSVRSGYALTGKVGRQLLRGNGLLAGNFTDVVADFTVELKRVGNKTLIVRAARAKLVAKEHSVKLQGMDEKGPVEAILAQGLMASEAVAAMIADDLATKALSERDSEDVVFKMYRNLPVIEKE